MRTIQAGFMAVVLLVGVASSSYGQLDQVRGDLVSGLREALGADEDAAPSEGAVSDDWGSEPGLRDDSVAPTDELAPTDDDVVVDAEEEDADGSSFGQAFGGLGDFLRGATGGGDGAEQPAEEDENEAKVSALRRDAYGSFEKERYHEAIRHLNDLIALRAFDPYYHFSQALCYRRLRQYDDALKKYQDVLDLGGPKPLISLLKAEVYAAEGKRDKVFEMIREAALGGRNIIHDVQNLELLAPYQKDTEFIQLALQLERIEIQPIHHDPFTNPFPTATGEGEGGEGGGSESDVAEVLSPSEQDALVREARQVFDQIQFFIKLQDEEKAMEAYQKLRGFIAQKQNLTIPKYVKDFQAIESKFADVEVEISGIRLRYYYNQAHGKIEEMERQFSEGQYARVRELNTEIHRLADDMTKANERFRPVADQIRDLSGQWVRRADVRLEFDTLKPEIQGVVISGATNLAILNDRIVKQGESLVDFRVVKVESNRVTFRYKGEEIPLVFRRY